ncbi:MAG: hypothetical protein H5T33_02435, partial [Candidatus Methanosuratus sp.]|nr:hypothetical protein [Candidatus Methanosuratincola sp.]
MAQLPLLLALLKQQFDLGERYFLVGVKVSGELAEREDAVKSEFGIEFGESMKM